MSFRACSLQDLTPGEGLRIDTVSPPIAVFLTEEGTVHALDDTCTHQDASLAAGWVEDCRVECPLHESTFSLTSGAVDQLRPSAGSVSTRWRSMAMTSWWSSPKTPRTFLRG